MGVQYNFKSIAVVPSGKDFVDIVLSKTQRKTPTIIHKGSAINRIRQFYMRKVKFTQQNYNEKLTKIIDDFPRLDNIHPFYSDLLNVLYDKDHYKLALGQLNTTRNIVDKISKDYVRLLKYGDSLYRCKALKRAALGRMCTLMRKQAPSLAYLEQVRQHMSRLPSIDPNTRTLLVCGYPNVGKSSFVNCVSRADVDVQPYAFTTKSLYVGHTDYKYLRWQVIDTPGILDHPLEERNTIEMLSITALAHLRCVVLFIIDLSGTCGYTIQQQAGLFNSIKPLFANKPLMVVCNKTDLQPLESLSAEERAEVEAMQREAAKCGSSLLVTEGLSGDDCLLTMSTRTQDNVGAVKTAACEKLLQQRVETKLKSKKMGDVANRIHVAVPRQRDGKERPPIIPQSVLERRAAEAATGAPVPALPAGTKLERDLQEENGGAGVFSADVNKRYLLLDDEWRYDVVPEIMDGHNVADFIDADILARLEELEREEEAAAEGDHAMAEDEEEEEGLELGEEEAEALKAIRYKKKLLLAEHRMKKSTAESRPTVPRREDKDRKFTVQRMERHLEGMGIDPTAAVERARSRSVVRGRKRERSADADAAAEAMDVDGESRAAKRARSRSRSRPVEAVPGDGFKDTEQKKVAIKIGKRAFRQRNKDARRGEGDRHIANVRPKHLLTGKRGIGKTDRR